MAILYFRSEWFKLFLICKSPRWFIPSFKSTGLSVQKKWKIDFQDGHHIGHLGFPIGRILAIFDLKVTPMLPIKFQVNWPLGSEEAKNRFSGRLLWWPSWISDWNYFSYFWSTSHPDDSCQVLCQLAFQFRRRSEKKIFKKPAMGAILDFQSEQF